MNSAYQARFPLNQAYKANFVLKSMHVLLFDSKNPAMPPSSPRLCNSLISIEYIFLLFFPIKKQWDENCFDI